MNVDSDKHLITEEEAFEFLIPLIGGIAHTPTVSSRVRIEYSAATHPGNVRPVNEDSYILFRTGRYLERLMTNLEADEIPDRHDEKAFAMAVADGIGGGPAGEMASRLAIRICMNLIMNSPNWALKLDNPETRQREITEAIDRAQKYFQKIDVVLKEAARHDPELYGMGTTLTGAYIIARDCFVIHAGDSRAYLFRDNTLTQITKDHTVAQELVNTGDISQEQASRHFMRHTLTSCLGGKSGALKLDIHRLDIKNGDRILLCTDGLSDEMTAQEITQVLKENSDSSSACDALLNEVLQKSARDNITITLAGYSILPNPNLQ